MQLDKAKARKATKTTLPLDNRGTVNGTKHKIFHTVDFNQICIFVADNYVNFTLVTSFADNPTVTGRLHYELSVIVHSAHPTSHTSSHSVSTTALLLREKCTIFQPVSHCMSVPVWQLCQNCITFSIKPRGFISDDQLINLLTAVILKATAVLF